MFGKFTPQAFTPEIKSHNVEVKPTETHNQEKPLTAETKSHNIAVKPTETEKPMTNLFGMKSSVPDVVKTSPPTLHKIEKPVEKVLEKSKEDIPGTSETDTQKGKDADKKENVVKPIPSATFKPSFIIFSVSISK